MMVQLTASAGISMCKILAVISKVVMIFSIITAGYAVFELLSASDLNGVGDVDAKGGSRGVLFPWRSAEMRPSWSTPSLTTSKLQMR